jgi:hypothetical protein
VTDDEDEDHENDARTGAASDAFSMSATGGICVIASKPHAAESSVDSAASQDTNGMSSLVDDGLPLSPRPTPYSEQLMYAPAFLSVRSMQLALIHGDGWEARWERRDDGRQIIVSGTLERLIAQLIESNQSEKLAILTGYSGPDYAYTFLLSHTYFTTSTFFLSKLQEHYFASLPSGLGPGELKVVESQHLGRQTRCVPLALPRLGHWARFLDLTRPSWSCGLVYCAVHHAIIILRIVNTLKRWIDNHYYFFEHDPLLLKAFDDFMKQLELHGDKHQEWAAALRVCSPPPTSLSRRASQLGSSRFACRKC